MPFGSIDARPQFALSLILCPFLVLSQVSPTFQMPLLKICHFIDAEPRPIWLRAGARNRRSLLGVLRTVLGTQHSPVDEVDAVLWLWGWWFCGESRMAVV